MGEVDADIRRASTLPSRYYTDPELFTGLLKHFKQQWCFAAHRCETQENNVLPLPHIEAQTGEPMLLSVQNEEARILSGVCTHRGMILTDRPCKTNVIQCPYHGRTFGLDGCFRAMPGFEGVEDFPTDKDDLATFDSGEWNGFFFASLEAKDFATWFAPFTKRMSWWPGSSSITYDRSRHRDHSIEANWIAYVDNYLEGFTFPSFMVTCTPPLITMIIRPNYSMVRFYRLELLAKASLASIYLRILSIMASALLPITGGSSQD